MNSLYLLIIFVESKNDIKKIRVNPVPSSVQCKSTFYKRSASSGVTSAQLPPTDVPSDSLSTGFTYCSLFQREPSETVSSFSFDFSNASGEDDGSMAQAATSVHVEPNDVSSDDHSSMAQAAKSAHVKSKITAIKALSSCSFSATGSDFRFDFVAD